MPSPSATPKPKVPIARAPKSSSASWPHPSKALEAAVTICPPSFVGATAKYPPTYITEQVSPKHQFLPLAPLSTISELPKMELLEGIGPSQPAAIPPSQEPGGSSQDAPTKPVELDRSGTLDEGESKKDKVRSTSGLSSMLPSAPPAEAANIPLPQSPVTESPQQLDSDLRESQAEATGQNPEPATEEKDTWGARLASILPQTIVDQLPRQDTRTDNARATRSASVAPGAYPESDSMEDTPIPTSGPNLEGVQAEVGQADRDTPVPDSGSIRPRKSVSIALPEADQGHEDTAAKQTDTTKSNEDTSAKLPAPSPEEDADNKEAAKQSRDQDTMVENEQPGEISQDKRQNANAVAESEQSVEPDQEPKPSASQADRDLLLKPVKSAGHRDGSPISRMVSVSTSFKDTDRADVSTLHERESLAPSDADNSSLLPLLPSSPRDARSSHFTESLDDHDPGATGTKAGKQAEIRHRTGTDSPFVVDDMYSLSTISSLAGSAAEETDKKKTSEYPFPPPDNGEGASKAAALLRTPKIVVKDASEAEDLLQSPPTRAPRTTPVQEGSLPRRQATFAALGEQLDHQGPVKLPMKRRRLYVRKARYVVLRQPILNAVLGRQVGAQAKLALRKLANGELVVIEPPTSL